MWRPWNAKAASAVEGSTSRLPRAFVVVVLAAVVVFGPVLAGPFLWDDKTLIRDSPGLKDPANLGYYLRHDFWALSAYPRANGMYRPLVTASYFFDRAVFGEGPLGPHAVNLLLHLIALGLVGLLARRLQATVAEASLASALFAFHPATVEAVANISSRGDLLATNLALGALLCLRGRGPRSLLLAGLLTGLSQLAKEATFVLLPLALVLEWWGDGGQVKPRRWLLISLALGTTSMAMLLLHKAVVGPVVHEGGVKGWVPIVSGATGVMRYAGLALFPSPLVPYQGPLEPSVGLTFGLALLVVAAVGLKRRAPLATAAVAWFLFATAPVAGWLPLDVRFSGLLLYLPLTGLACLAARGLVRVRSRVAWIIPVAEAVMAAMLVPMWKSDETLWRANVDAFPELAAPRVNLANALAQRGDPEAAEAYRAAVAAAEASNDQSSLGLAELGWGNLTLQTAPIEAEEHFARAHLASGGLMWQAAINRAVSLALQQRFGEAEALLERQWQLTPLSAIANVGVHLAEEAQDPEGQRLWRARLAEARRAPHERRGPPVSPP